MINNKKLLSSFYLFLFLFIFFNSCNSPESTDIKKKAALKISLGEVPIILTYNSTYGYWRNYSVKVIISETDGVGCRISIVKRELIFKGSPTWPETQEVNDRINAFGSTYILFDIYTYSNEYEKVRFTVEGGDDNGNKLKRSADFDIYYYNPTNEVNLKKTN